jgi:hypothetical protein
MKQLMDGGSMARLFPFLCIPLYPRIQRNALSYCLSVWVDSGFHVTQPCPGSKIRVAIASDMAGIVYHTK